jgi:lipoprotein-releasing system permease protein
VEGKTRKVREVLGDRIEAISPVIEAYAMLEFRFRQYSPEGWIIGESDPIVKPVRLMGVDPKTKSLTGEFASFLEDKDNRENPSECFQLRGEAEERYRQYHPAVPPWVHERMESGPQTMRFAQHTLEGPPPTEPPQPPAELQKVFGAVVGHGIATFRRPNAKRNDENKDEVILQPGDEMKITTVSRTQLEGHDGSRGHPRPVTATFVITDTFKSGMSEIDSNLIYIDIADMQRLRTMENRATSLQIKLKDYDRYSHGDKEALKEALYEHFNPMFYMIATWEEKQGTLLAAIAIERGLLNVLLFLIITVAGFGILAIFFMIVVEKMRDIGILKALGASNAGVMGIFLCYGLALGLVGAGLGTLFGVSITVYINEIEGLISKVTGQEVFDRSVYYFDKIPTDIQPLSVLLVNLGAIGIAVGASVFPALRAALLHPVRALRYE